MNSVCKVVLKSLTLPLVVFCYFVGGNKQGFGDFFATYYTCIKNIELCLHCRLVI